jgi:hypothetical protein
MQNLSDLMYLKGFEIQVKPDLENIITFYKTTENIEYENK